MTKETIIERLLDQGHITIPSADVILNKKPDYVEIIESLHTDGPVNTEEAVILLSDPYYEPAKFPFGTPNIQTFPCYPPPHDSGNPTWQVPDINCEATESELEQGVPGTTIKGPTGNCGSVGTDGTNRPIIKPSYLKDKR